MTVGLQLLFQFQTFKSPASVIRDTPHHMTYMYTIPLAKLFYLSRSRIGRWLFVFLLWLHVISM